MATKRRAAFAGLLLIGLLTSCSGVRGEGMFAYRDHEGRAAIYDLASGRVIWRSDCAVHTRPEWSPKGDLPGFAFADPSDGHEYVGYVELGNMTVVKVDLSQTAESFLWPVPGELEWSPSGVWLMLESGGYLGHAAVIVDIHKLSIVHSFVTTGRVLWSPDGDHVCYAVVHGKAVDRSPSLRKLFPGLTKLPQIPKLVDQTALAAFNYFGRPLPFVKNQSSKSA